MKVNSVMPCGITDTPIPDVEDIEYPPGVDVIRALPNQLANELIREQIDESSYGGKSHLQHIFDLALSGKDAQKLMRAVLICAAEAGNTDYAHELYERHVA